MLELGLDRGHGGTLLLRQEALDRGDERDRRRGRAIEPVELIGAQPRHAVEECRERRSPIGRGTAGGRPGAGRRARRSTEVVPAGRAPSPAGPDPALLVVSGAEFRVAQPVVRDIDRRGGGETVRPGDVRVMTSEQRSPGDLDRLRGRVGRDLESRVEVVGGQQGTRGHARNATRGPRPGPGSRRRPAGMPRPSRSVGSSAHRSRVRSPPRRRRPASGATRSGSTACRAARRR